jgi:hypothetical protein
MNRDDIIRMAREAGFKPEFFSPEGIDMWERFGQLVAAAEREACAEWLESGLDLAGLAGLPELQQFTVGLLLGCAHAIRARGDA